MATLSSAYRQQKDPAARRGQTKAAQPQRNDISAGAATKSSPRRPDPEVVENALRQFDLSTDYGPCTDMTRLQRWHRAERLGLNPPSDIKQLLEQYGDMGESLWHGRL